MTMAPFLRENTRPAFLSLLLHGAIAVALLFAADISFHHASLGGSAPIEATVVDSRLLVKAAATHRTVAPPAPAPTPPAPTPQPSAAAVQQALEQRQAEQQHLALQRAAEQAAAAAKRQAAAIEAQREAAIEAKRAAAVQAKREAVAEARREAAAQAKREAVAEANREAAAQAKREAAAEARREAARQAKRKAAAQAAARAAMQAELRQQIQAEERADAIAEGPLADAYRAALQSRIIQAWIKPPAAKAGIDCLVRVTQVPGGEVTHAQVTQCNGDAAVRQSIENAVYRASPLPTPPDPSLFHRTLILEFKPDE